MTTPKGMQPIYRQQPEEKAHPPLCSICGNPIYGAGWEGTVHLITDWAVVKKLIICDECIGGMHS
jgi:hypothetical protein